MTEDSDVRNDVPELRDEVKRLRGQVTRLQSQYDSMERVAQEANRACIEHWNRADAAEESLAVARMTLARLQVQISDPSPF